MAHALGLHWEVDAAPWRPGSHGDPQRTVPGIPLRKGDKGPRLEDTVGVLGCDMVGTPEKSVEEGTSMWDFGRGIQVGNFGSWVEAFGGAAKVGASYVVEGGS